jgi:TonB family protein
MTGMFRFISALAFLMISFSVSAQFRDGAVYDDLYDGETVAALKAHVRELSASHLEGRKAGSEGEKAAAEYVTEVLKSYGVDVISPADGDVFGLKTESGDTLTSRNVTAFVQGYDKNLRNQYIVVGARLDNLGTMTVTVDGKPVEKVYCGANGNASGLAVLMELARMVQTNSIMFRRSVLFVAFGASSESFAGSWYFLNRSFSDVDKIDAMINLDMLGTGYRGFYAYTASNMDLNSIARTLSGDLQPILPEVVTTEVYPSDHRAFYDKEIPAVHFTTGRFPEHNTDRDTQSIIDYDNMERELEYIYNFTLTLANASYAPSFRPDKSSAKLSSGENVTAYNDCDQKPMFLNSQDPRKFLKEWVYQYIKYPERALMEGIQGRVQVDFIVEKDGRVTNVKVSKGVSEELDAEAVKVISASPKWRAGRVDGEKVRTAMTIPVEFRLEKKGGKSSFGIKK